LTGLSVTAAPLTLSVYDLAQLGMRSFTSNLAGVSGSMAILMSPVHG